jgi:hypothetical protein
MNTVEKGQQFERMFTDGIARRVEVIETKQNGTSAIIVGLDIHEEITAFQLNSDWKRIP